VKGWRFYEEFQTEKRKVSTGNVIALDVVHEPFPALDVLTQGVQFQHSCISSVYFQPNSPVSSSGVSIYYRRHYCKRISEAKARTIHPKLFEYLEGGE